VAALVADLRHDWQGAGEVLARLEAVVPLDATRSLDNSRDLSSGKSQSSAGSGSDPGTGGRPRRRPVRLGRGLVDGTAEAALWLLGRPGAVALVDGYNVTMLAWPDLTVLEQRRRLEQAAIELQQRTGARVVLVFDGDDDGGAAVRAAVGSPVRVRFTHRDVEADDEILAMVEASDADVLVVVSNDARVVDGARERGANVVRSTELVALVRSPVAPPRPS